MRVGVRAEAASGAAPTGPVRRGDGRAGVLGQRRALFAAPAAARRAQGRRQSQLRLGQHAWRPHLNADASALVDESVRLCAHEYSCDTVN